MRISHHSLLPLVAGLLTVRLLTACTPPCAAQSPESAFTWPESESDPGERPPPAWSLWTEVGGAEGDTGGGDDQRQSGDRGGGGGQEGGPAKGKADLPAPLGPYISALNPAQLQYLLEECLGGDVSKWSEKPRAPEIPLAIFRETIRPLGALKYENQPNFFLASFTGQAPTQESFSYDYVFADWHALRVETTWYNGDPHTFVFGYQRTLGVGPDHNWVHGLTLLPEYVAPAHFFGGSAVYTLGWKPREKSPWTLAPVVGVNRVDRDVEGGVKGVWRPLVSMNVFYTLSDSWTIGVENDALPSSQLGEYLVMPLVNFRPVQHFFVQAGAGYYQVGSDSQATFMFRANLLFPSPRQNR